MKRSPILFFMGFLVFTAMPAFSAIITFTHTGFGSGTLDGTPFATSDFTITAQGDTDNRDTFSGGYYLDHDIASISITGLGTFQFTTGTRTFVNNLDSLVGFSREGQSGLDLFDGPSADSFATWDMLSSIGPITGGGELLQWGVSPSVVTNAGVLAFTNSRFEGATFVATSISEEKLIPEPGTIILLGSGLLGLLGFGRNKVKK